MTIKALISAAGKSFEFVKSLLEAVSDAGGEVSHLDKLLADPEQREQLARHIVGGPWQHVGLKKEMTVDWDIPFRDFVRDSPSEISFGCIIDEKWKSVFNPLFPEHIPTGKTTMEYEIVPLPIRITKAELEEWMSANAPRLATDRELIRYAAGLDFKCSILALGSRSDSGVFPLLDIFPNSGAESGFMKCSFMKSFGWEGLIDSKSDKHAFAGLRFVLLRVMA